MPINHPVSSGTSVRSPSHTPLIYRNPRCCTTHRTTGLGASRGVQGSDLAEACWRDGGGEWSSAPRQLSSRRGRWGRLERRAVPFHARAPIEYPTDDDGVAKRRGCEENDAPRGLAGGKDGEGLHLARRRTDQAPIVPAPAP